jgi:hypothetical protein
MCKDPLTQGTVLTIMTGGSVTGSFNQLPENRALLTGGLPVQGVLSGQQRETDRHARAVPPTAPPGQAKR